MNSGISDEFFKLFPDRIHFEIFLSAPFPILINPVTSLRIHEDEFLLYFRIQSRLVKNGNLDLLEISNEPNTMHTYPSLQPETRCAVTFDLGPLPPTGRSHFDKIFGNKIWQHTHKGFEKLILDELNRIIDLSRSTDTWHYLLRNISIYDMEKVTLYEVIDENPRLLSTLFPQVMGKIEYNEDHIATAKVVPFYFRNYLDANRHYAEHRYREMQISACNTIEAGSWYIWDKANELFTLHPSSKADYRQRLNSTSKSIKHELGANIGVPTKSINKVWKRRQKAMHGEEILMQTGDAASILVHLQKFIDFIYKVDLLLENEKKK